jgi:hypothetical protein
MAPVSNLRCISHAIIHGLEQMDFKCRLTVSKLWNKKSRILAILTLVSRSILTSDRVSDEFAADGSARLFY